MNTTYKLPRTPEFSSDWGDDDMIKNIRVKGCYPDVKHHKKPIRQFDPRLKLQYKPYGIASETPDPFDDRPDWFKFHVKKEKKYYEEITPRDPEFNEAIEQDHDMHIPHNHTHIKEIEQDTSSEEIGDTIVI